MVAKKSATGTKKKLKVKKQTLRNLDVRRSVKGGIRFKTLGGCIVQGR